MKHLLLLILSLTFLNTGTAAFADDQSDGCGIGLAVTNKKTLIGTTTRATTHNYLICLHPSWGMSSGTSNCTQHSFVQKEGPAAMFALENFEPLSIEMAEGHGEYVNAFARTFGCQDGSAFNDVMQKNYRAIFNDTKNGMDMYYKVKQELKQNTVLAQSCTAV